MTLTYRKKVELALLNAPNIDTVHEIAGLIAKTSQLNRRTKAGRELTEELLNLCNKKVRDLAEAGEEPF